MPVLRLTATSIDSIQAPPPKADESGKLKPHQVIYRDPKLTGLGVRVTSSGKKVFIAEKVVDRKVIRTTLGDATQITVYQAWNEAQKVFGKIASGTNPHEEKRAERARSVTLGESLEDLLKARKQLAERTVYDYKRLVNTYLGDWKGKAMADITKDMVERRHARIGEDSGPAQANYTMRVLRSLFNFATEKYEVDGEPFLTINPVSRLSRTKAWYRVDRRTTYIKPDQLKPWFAAVLAVEEGGRDYLAGARDYLLLLILTGMRKSEGLKLKWQDVDLANKAFTIRDTKNHQDHTLPMSDYLAAMLLRRHAKKRNEYVFPGIGLARNGHQQEPKKAVAAVAKASGVPFTLHDLRRTFITVAESLDISAYAVKRLANHKMRNDVTAGYIVTDVERLRRPMQQITDFILRTAGVVKSADIADLGEAREAKGKTAA